MKELLNTLVSWGPTGLWIAALLDGAGVPVPSGVDVLIVFLSTKLPSQAVWLAFVAVLGSVSGNFLLFLLARRGGKAYLEKRSSSKRTIQFRKWFDQYGLLTVFVAALVPLPVMPLKIFVISSGALGSSPIRFLIAFVGARIPRYLGLALLGRAMGGNAMLYLKEHVWHMTAFAVALFLILAWLVRYGRSRTLVKTE